MALAIVALIVALAFWRRGNHFLALVAGPVAMGFGVHLIATYDGFIYIMSGIACIGIGLYLLIDTGVDLLKGE